MLFLIYTSTSSPSEVGKNPKTESTPFFQSLATNGGSPPYGENPSRENVSHPFPQSKQFCEQSNPLPDLATDNSIDYPMEKSRYRGAQLAITPAVIVLGLVAFSCCIAAEFTNSKAARDMKLDGSLCSLQRSSAFALGITALVCLSLAQIAGTTAAGSSLCSGNSRKSRRTFIALLILSWLSFGLAAIMLGTASSMSNHQAYGRGWLDGDCYLVKDGVYIGSAILAVSTVIFILGFTLTAKRTTI